MLRQTISRTQCLSQFTRETLALNRIFSTQNEGSKREDEDFGEDLVQEALERAKLKASQQPQPTKPQGQQQLQQQQQTQQQQKQQQQQNQFSGEMDDSDVEGQYTRSWKNLGEVPTLPARLAYLGTIPLWALSPPVVRNILDPYLINPYLGTSLLVNAGQLQMVYAAGILSFLGAVHWGVALVDGKDYETASNRENAVRYLWGVTPMLISWPTAVLLDPGQAGLLMTALLWIAIDIDSRMTARGMLPPWYMRVRTPVSLIAMAAVTLTFADSYARYYAEKNKEMMAEEMAYYEATGRPMETPEVIERFIAKLRGQDQPPILKVSPPSNIAEQD